MAMKINYGFERAERNRAKQAKRDAKAKAKTKSERDAEGAAPEDTAAAGDAGEPARSDSKPE